MALELSESTEHDAPARIRSSVVVSDEIPLGDFSVFTALRAQLIRGQPFQLLPRLGASWRASDAFTLSLALGRSVRSPSLDELYHPTEAGLEGNPALVPETAWEIESKAELQVGPSTTLSVTGFARSVDDTILYLNRNAFVIRPENAGGSNTAGAEIEGRLAAAAGRIRIEADLSGAAMISELAATDARVPTQPALSSDVGALIGLVDHDGADWIELWSRVRLVGPTTANLSGTLTTEPFVRWDAGLSTRMFDAGTFALVVTNLLDEEALETVNKIPLPGRMVMVSLAVTTGGAPG